MILVGPCLLLAEERKVVYVVMCVIFLVANAHNKKIVTLCKFFLR